MEQDGFDLFTYLYIVCRTLIEMLGWLIALLTYSRPTISS